MKPEKIEGKIRELQQEYQKGLALLQETQSKMLRIEGAIIKLQELLKEWAEEKEHFPSINSLNDIAGKVTPEKNLEPTLSDN